MLYRVSIVGIPKRGRSPLTKPAPDSLIDWQHPLAQGLKNCFLNRELVPRDEVTKKRALLQDSPSWGTPKTKIVQGESCITLEAAGDLWASLRAADSTIPTAGDITFVGRVFFPNFANQYRPLWAQNTTGGDSRMCITHIGAGLVFAELSSGDPSYENKTWVNKSIADNAWHTLSLSQSGILGRFIIDNRLQTTTSDNYVGQLHAYTYINSVAGLSSGYATGMAFAYGYLYQRFLSPEVVFQLHASPYQMFWEPRQTLYFNSLITYQYARPILDINKGSWTAVTS